MGGLLEQQDIGLEWILLVVCCVYGLCGPALGWHNYCYYRIWGVGVPSLYDWSSH